jgi:hypothetical protein
MPHVDEPVAKSLQLPALAEAKQQQQEEEEANAMEGFNIFDMSYTVHSLASVYTVGSCFVQ